MLSCNRPPIAKLWPLPSWTVVSARLTVSEGTTKVALLPMPAAIVTAFALLISLTSGATWMEIRPSLNTVGRKFSDTPKFL